MHTNNEPTILSNTSVSCHDSCDGNLPRDIFPSFFFGPVVLSLLSLFARVTDERGSIFQLKLKLTETVIKEIAMTLHKLKHPPYHMHNHFQSPWGMRHPRNGIGYCLGTSITSWNF
ncbi:hypothetical protein QQP08_000496 [Theobroma cacao]|nr:hypothetical protein QQP08_000496 [Theobroma cacao]